MEKFAGFYQVIQIVLLGNKKFTIALGEGDCETKIKVTIPDELVEDPDLEKFVERLEEKWQEEESHFIISFKINKSKKYLLVYIEFVGAAPRVEMEFDEFLEN